ncbi:MAG: ASCH domain-containing protein [Opitutales bacterium]|nr:ASCH domain-containing protein [Opitutales bacterium]
MKALSIKQPWAALIAAGAKDVENRTWFTSQRGTFLIHASATRSRAEFEEAYIAYRHAADCDENFARNAVDEISGGFLDAAYGQIIGCADIADCTRAQSSPWHYNGYWGFYLANARQFPKPIPALGALGFWNFDIDLDAALGVEQKRYIGRALPRHGTVGD